MARSKALGAVREADLTAARIRYRERGEGPPVAFVHGLLVNADLWREVVPRVAAAGFRCIAPDWPLGSHEIAVPGADLTPPGVAALIAEFLDKLDLRDVTIVASDTGGALTQILMTQHPERIERVVLTPSDSFEHFFPPMFRPLTALAHVPGSMRLLSRMLGLRAVQRLPIAFGWLTKRPLPPEVTDSYIAPVRRDRAIRNDLGRFLRTVHRRHTLAAAQLLPEFNRPVLLAWATEDRIFPFKQAHRLAEVLPDATVIGIEDAYTFVPEDQPEELSRLIVEFVRKHAAA